LVRMLFNDFWSAAYEKPAGFVERLDQAEDYVNARLAANGEAWRLDSKTRVMLGLPPRGEYGRSALGTTRLGRSRPRRLAPGYRQWSTAYSLGSRSLRPGVGQSR
jgi:hypothetical protein